MLTLSSDLSFEIWFVTEAEIIRLFDKSSTGEVLPKVCSQDGLECTLLYILFCLFLGSYEQHIPLEPK